MCIRDRFVALPSGAGTLINRVTDNRILINLAAGAVRIAILVGYMLSLIHI